MFPNGLTFIYSILLIILTICILESATNNEKLQPYLPPLNNNNDQQNNRFLQIMQGGGGGGGGANDISKMQSPPIKTEIDIKTEIEKLNTSYVYQGSWPAANVKLGAVTAVSFDKDGNVVIFHRCDRVWDINSFDYSNVFKQTNLGPIRESTVLAFDHVNGNLVYEWGKNLFYMPHGLTIDHENNVWITDVALHQVFKFGPRGSNDTPLLTLGTKFTPGAGDTKFCKPTSVAVLENGDFFVADGYCNARILKYSKNGEKILSWGQNTFAGTSYKVAPENYFAIPHALTLVPEKQLVCTADRENGRIQCFFWHNGTFHSQYHNPIIGDRLFSMAYTQAEGGEFIIVNGPTGEIGAPSHHYNEVRGYVMNMKTKDIISKFGPNNLQFQNPHDVAVTADGQEIYIAELDPKRIHKFLHKSVAKTVSISAAKKTNSNGIGPEYIQIDQSKPLTSIEQHNEDESSNHKAPGGTAILVASLMLLFAFLTFTMAFLIARRRKRGNTTQLGVGQPSELVYRKLVASTQNICDDCP